VLSLSPLTILDASPAEQVSAAAQVGFDAVGLRVARAGDERVWPMLADTPMMRETLGRLADTGLRVLDVELVMIRPDHRLSDVLPVLDAAVRLGARFVNVVGYDPEHARLIERFGALCEAAGERDLQLDLEFMKYSEVKTLGAAFDIVEQAEHPAATVLVDALHLQRSGGTPADVRRHPPAHRPYLQLCDGPLEPVWPDDDAARAESRGNRLLPGDGALPLHELVADLPRGGVLSVEAPVAALAALPVAERARLAHAAADRLLRSTARDRG
jgi:sugar phosphate isomerase/epimerase